MSESPNADRSADIKDGQAGQYLKDTREAATLHKQISDTLGSNYWLGTPAVATGVGWLKVSHQTQNLLRM